MPQGPAFQAQMLNMIFVLSMTAALPKMHIVHMKAGLARGQELDTADLRKAPVQSTLCTRACSKDGAKL